MRSCLEAGMLGCVCLGMRSAPAGRCAAQSGSQNVGLRMSRHTFRVGWKLFRPVRESLHRTVYVPAYTTRRIRFRRAASRWGFDKSRMPWHAECAGNTPARTLDWLPLAATGHTSRNTPVRHGHPMIMNPNDLRQRKTLRAIFVSSPTGFMQLVLRCDVADAATVDRRVATSVSATQAFGLLP